jgi:hypothetical protein
VGNRPGNPPPLLNVETQLLMDLKEDPVTRTTVIGMLRVMG